MFTRKKQGLRSFFPFSNLSLGNLKYRSDQNPERTQPKLFPQYGAFAKRSSLTAPKKCTFYFNVTVFSTKVLIWDTIFLRLLLETGPPFYMVIWVYPLQGKGSTLISQLL